MSTNVSEESDTYRFRIEANNCTSQVEVSNYYEILVPVYQCTRRLTPENRNP